MRRRWRRRWQCCAAFTATPFRTLLCHTCPAGAQSATAEVRLYSSSFWSPLMLKAAEHTCQQNTVCVRPPICQKAGVTASSLTKVGPSHMLLNACQFLKHLHSASTGSYSYVALGASGRTYEALAKPVRRRLLWAGEHTSVQVHTLH